MRLVVALSIRRYRHLSPWGINRAGKTFALSVFGQPFRRLLTVVRRHAEPYHGPGPTSESLFKAVVL